MAAVAPLTTRVGLVAEAIAVPFRYHWYEGAGVPVAGALKTTVLPLAIVWDEGWLTKAGASEGFVSEMTLTE